MEFRLRFRKVTVPHSVFHPRVCNGSRGVLVFGAEGTAQSSPGINCPLGKNPEVCLERLWRIRKQVHKIGLRLSLGLTVTRL